MKVLTEKQIRGRIDRFSSLKTRRSIFESHCQDISDYILPFGNPFTYESEQDDNRMSKIYDSIGLHSNQLFASGLFSLLTSPAQRWFSYTTANQQVMDIRDVQLWLSKVTHITYSEINRPIARFNASTHENYLEYGAYGNCILYVTEHATKQALNFVALPMSDCYFDENDQGIVDTVYRRYNRTVKYLVDKFGKDAVHEEVRKMYDAGKYDAVVKGLHIIGPNKEVDGFSKPYLSLYIDMDHKHQMRLSGYFELPIMVPRMYKSTGSVYAWGPGSYALPDVKMCQEIMRTTIRAAQKATDPPMQLPDEGYLNPIRVSPGGLNYYRAGTQDRIEPMNFGTQPKIGMDMLNAIHEKIREVFFADQLQLAQGPQMTATEVIQRTEEKLRIMGPVLGTLTTEYLGPMLARVFGILKRMNKYPPMPEALANQPFTIEYSSPIARAQEQVEANGLLRTMQVLSPFVQADPFIMDNFDGDELANGVSRMFSVSPKYMVGKKAVAAKRKQRREDMLQAREGEDLRAKGQGLESLTRAGMNLETMDLEGVGGILGG